MRKLYHKLLQTLNISGRELAVFLLALLLAFSIWLIHNLSLKYNDYLTSTVIAQCNLDGHTDFSVNESDIVARCRATGYKVILSDIRAHRKPVTVTFNPSVLKHAEDDLFHVISSDLTEYAHLIFGDGVTLDHFVTDTVFFRFPEVAPDSVTIYGEAHRLANIDKVYTEPIKYSNLSSDVQGVIRLEKIRDVRISESEVHYMLDVKRYVEITRTLPVKVLNVPSDKIMQIYPSSATVRGRFSFPLAGNVHEEMELEVDYLDYASSLSGKCRVNMSYVPKGLMTYEIDPVTVSCLLEDK